MKGKVVVITGASSGIGRATALKFLKKGSFVVLAARTFDKNFNGLGVFQRHVSDLKHRCDR